MSLTTPVMDAWPKVAAGTSANNARATNAARAVRMKRLVLGVGGTLCVDTRLVGGIIEGSRMAPKRNSGKLSRIPEWNWTRPAKAPVSFSDSVRVDGVHLFFMCTQSYSFSRQ